MTPTRPPRFRITVYQLQDGKTTEVVDAYGTAFITAVATIDGDTMEVHFNDGGPRDLQPHIAAAIAHEYQRPR